MHPVMKATHKKRREGFGWDVVLPSLAYRLSWLTLVLCFSCSLTECSFTPSCQVVENSGLFVTKRRNKHGDDGKFAVNVDTNAVIQSPIISHSSIWLLCSRKAGKFDPWLDPSHQRDEMPPEAPDDDDDGKKTQQDDGQQDTRRPHPRPFWIDLFEWYWWLYDIQ